MRKPKVAMIKLAAIGDVAIACRALAEAGGGAEWHWFIDAGLIGLARELLRRLGWPISGDDPAGVRFHPADSARLFNAGLAGKAVESIRLASRVAALRPSAVAVLHRDRRYRMLLRPVVLGRIVSLAGAAKNELDAYRDALCDVMRGLGKGEAGIQPAKTAHEEASISGRKIGHVGLLLGGARNQKLDYREKRWPRFGELAKLLLEKTDSTLVIFGSGDDRAAADSILASIGSDPKAISRVTDLVGKTALADLPGKLADLDTFVSIDSGLAHVAAAVMTAPHQRVIPLFGPSDPAIWAPKPSGNARVEVHCLNSPCSPCYRNDGRFQPCIHSGKDFQLCMTGIRSEDVLGSINAKH